MPTDLHMRLRELSSSSSSSSSSGPLTIAEGVHIQLIRLYGDIWKITAMIRNESAHTYMHACETERIDVGFYCFYIVLLCRYNIQRGRDRESVCG